MKVQIRTRIVHGRGFARKGDVIDVSEARGAALVRRELATQVFPTKAATGAAQPAPTDSTSSAPAAESDTQPRPDGSPTGRAITSSSLQPDQARTKRRYTKRGTKQKSSP